LLEYALVARIFLERRELGEEVRRLFELLGRERPDGGVPGECTPPLDVVETATTVEIVMDIPGVAAADIQVVFGGGVVAIGGRKLPPGCEHGDAAFHLAERGFGRFARAVRVNGAFDGGRATATLAAGELRVVLPRIEERRGRELRIPVTAQ
jgi:HSP20 family protein